LRIFRFLSVDSFGLGTDRRAMLVEIAVERDPAGLTDP